MFRNLLLAASIGAIVLGVAANRLYARAGNLDKPGISIPAPGGTLDATVAAMNAALVAHEKQFVGGHYLNAQSVLQFAGGAKTINSLLAELSKIEGTILYVKFSGDAALVATLPGASEKPAKPCDCVVEHNAWADAYAVSMTIYVGDGVKIEDLSLPAIRGHAAP